MSGRRLPDLAEKVGVFLDDWDRAIFTSEMGNVVQEREVQEALREMRVAFYAVRTEKEES